MAKSQRPTMRRSVEIAAPVDEVFAYYANPENQPEVWPSLVEVRDVRYEDGKPTYCAWTYKMAGMRFEGTSKITAYEPNRLYAFESTGGINSWKTIRFEAVGDMTVVDEEVEYEIPMPLIGRFAERFLRRTNENELATIHANLKARMEAGVRADGAPA